jgi:hypothetical protein
MGWDGMKLAFNQSFDCKRSIPQSAVCHQNNISAIFIVNVAFQDLHLYHWPKHLVLRWQFLACVKGLLLDIWLLIFLVSSSEKLIFGITIYNMRLCMQINYKQNLYLKYLLSDGFLIETCMMCCYGGYKTQR